MEEIFEIAGAIIISLGGSTMILFGLSSFLSKVWINRITEKQKSTHLKEIEGLRAKLNAELKKLDMANEKAVFVTKLQYEKEFSIFLELWEDMFNCVQSTLYLYPRGLVNVPVDEEEKEKYNKEKLDRHIDAYNTFIKTINKYAPFYNKEFDEILNSIRLDCYRIGDIFRTYTFDVKYSMTYEMCRDEKISKEERNEVYKILPENISKNKEKLREQIREYLNNLQGGQN